MGNLGLGWEGKGNKEERTEGGASVNQTSTDWPLLSSTWDERTYRRLPDQQVAGREGEEGGTKCRQQEDR